MQVSARASRQLNLDIRVTRRATPDTARMTFESMLSKMGTGSKQIADRYAEYGAPVQDPHLFYTYEPSPQVHAEAASKHTHGGGHKNNAAMSALTLLAFLFFLHILQQCIKDHMVAMSTPQITIMTAGREGETALKKGDAKIDKSGLTDLEKGNANDKKVVTNDNENKYLMKINTAEPPRYNPQNYKSIKTYDRRNNEPGFVSVIDRN